MRHDMREKMRRRYASKIYVDKHFDIVPMRWSPSNPRSLCILNAPLPCHLPRGRTTSSFVGVGVLPVHNKLPPLRRRPLTTTTSTIDFLPQAVTIARWGLFRQRHLWGLFRRRHPRRRPLRPPAVGGSARGGPRPRAGPKKSRSVSITS